MVPFSKLLIECISLCNGLIEDMLVFLRHHPLLIHGVLFYVAHGGFKYFRILLDQLFIQLHPSAFMLSQILSFGHVERHFITLS